MTRLVFCVADPFMRVSLSEISVSTKFGWVWVLSSCAAMSTSTYLMYRLRRDVGRKHSVAAVHACLTVFVNCNLHCKQPVRNWIANMTDNKEEDARADNEAPPLWRTLVYFLLHIPFLMLASIPAAGYVIDACLKYSMLSAFLIRCSALTYQLGTLPSLITYSATHFWLHF